HHSFRRVAAEPGLVRRGVLPRAAVPRGALLCRAPADPLAAALPDRAQAPPQERQSGTVVGAGHAPGRAPALFLGGAGSLDRAVAPGARDLYAGACRPRAG